MVFDETCVAAGCIPTLHLACCVAISLCLVWHQIIFDLQAQVILHHPKLSDIATPYTYLSMYITISFIMLFICQMFYMGGGMAYEGRL